MSAESTTSTTCFLPLPARVGGVLRLVGPEPAEGPTAVAPLVRLDGPLGPAVSVAAALCTPDGQGAAPLEAWLLDPSAAELGPIPTDAVARAVAAIPGLFASAALGERPAWLATLQAGGLRLGVLLYCRKRHAVFEALAPDTLQPLVPAAVEAPAPSPASLRVEVLATVKSADGDFIRCYGGAGGDSAIGPVQSLEQLVLDQGTVAAQIAALPTEDPRRATLVDSHTCVGCAERPRCHPTDGAYAFAVDRLAVLSPVPHTAVLQPYGELSLDQAVRMMGGVPPGDALHADAGGAPGGAGAAAFAELRRRRAVRFLRGPRTLLGTERSGRELVEICRLKTGLIAAALEQCDRAWRQTGVPHLAWTDDALRVACDDDADLPACLWGLRTVTRRLGLHPAAPVRNAEGDLLAYPPAWCAPDLLPPEAADAMRQFGAESGARVYVKSSSADATGARVTVLLEDTGIKRGLLSMRDLFDVNGDGWRATLAPTGTHDPNDGDGLALTGRVIGNVGALKPQSDVGAARYRWYPRFGQACDLYALGVLLLDALLAHDERPSPRYREQLRAERAEFTSACMAVEAENRGTQARSWIAARCEDDAPASLWSRRGLCYRRQERSAARLDGFPPLLWQAVIEVALRATTFVPGFSYAIDRAADAPRSGESSLPLLELRGLLALMDDVILGRAEAIAALRTPGG